MEPTNASGRRACVCAGETKCRSVKDVRCSMPAQAFVVQSFISLLIGSPAQLLIPSLTQALPGFGVKRPRVCSK